MRFFDAIKICFINYLGFSGRAGRAEYFCWQVFAKLGLISAAAVDIFLIGSSEFLPAFYTFALVILLPTLAVSFRRFHDLGLPGAWGIIGLNYIGFLLMLPWTIKHGDVAENKYGQAPPLVARDAESSPTPKLLSWAFCAVVITLWSALLLHENLSYFKILPNSQVLAGNEVPRHQLDTLIDNGLVGDDEAIEFFYSEGLFSVYEGGQFFTANRLVSYSEEQGSLDIAEMPIMEIHEVALQYEGNAFEDSVYYVYGNESSEWEYIVIYLSRENDGDRRFLQGLLELMRNNNQA